MLVHKLTQLPFSTAEIYYIIKAVVSNGIKKKGLLKRVNVDILWR